MQRAHLPKPRLRGRLHQVAFFASIPAGVALVALARGARPGRAPPSSPPAHRASTVSAAYHRGRWSARALKVMRRLDHCMIFVLIAGSYTPVVLLALRPSWGITLLVVSWMGAALGVVITVLRLERWPAVGFTMYLILGWLVIVAAPQLAQSLSAVELGLLATGGLLYTVGAVVLASGRPDPRPATFGYHEIWHTFVVSASAPHFAGTARATVTAAGRDRVASVATSAVVGGRRCRWRPGGEGGRRRRRGRGRRRAGRRRGGGPGPPAAGRDPGPVAAHRGQRRWPPWGGRPGPRARDRRRWARPLRRGGRPGAPPQKVVWGPLVGAPSA